MVYVLDLVANFTRLASHPLRTVGCDLYELNGAACVTPESQLSAALESAYAVFERYPQPRRLEASCVYGDEDFLSALVSAPLRDLTCDQLGRFAMKALTSVGHLDDYKHFLPRLLDHVVDEGCAYLALAPEEFAERLAYGGWQTWPEQERQAILAVFRMALAQSADAPPEISQADDWHRAVERLEVEV